MTGLACKLHSDYSHWADNLVRYEMCGEHDGVRSRQCQHCSAKLNVRLNPNGANGEGNDGASRTAGLAPGGRKLANREIGRRFDYMRPVAEEKSAPSASTDGEEIVRDGRFNLDAHRYFHPPRCVPLGGDSRDYTEKGEIDPNVMDVESAPD